MKKNLLLTLSTIAFGYASFAQIVNIPDANFKAYLVGNTAINTNADTEIQVSEATSFAGAINCSGMNITNLTGIEAFTALTQLFCQNNQLTVLDVSTNSALTLLNCQNNLLSSLNITGSSALTELGFMNNQLTVLNVSTNTALFGLQGNNNNLSSLNVKNGNNTNFTYFLLNNNPNLSCIEVDDATYSTTNWEDVDAIASFSEDCTGTIGILENQNTHFNLFPNPASINLTIQSDVVINQIHIFNLLGELVQSEKLTTFSVEQLPFGIYMIQVQTERGITNLRFVKQ